MIYNILISIFDLFLFQNCICRILPFFSMFDELICIINCLFIIVICSLRPNRLKSILQKEKELLILLVIIIIIGVIGNIRTGYQQNIIAILKDIFSISKFILIYISSLLLFNKINKDLLLNKLVKRLRVYVIIFFIFALINLFFNIGMGYDVRYGIRSYKFLYSHPTYLVFSIILIICIFIAQGSKKNNIYVYVSLIILATTARSKALIFILLYFFMNFIMRNLEKVKLKQLLLFIAISCTLASKKIIEYFSYGYMSARPALYLTGLKLVKDCFPVGSGFGTFASSISAKYYSNIYVKYHLNMVWGMSKDNYSYIADTFWPYIYGQFGILGFIIFLIILLNIYKSMKHRYMYSNNKIKAVNLLTIYLIISSIAEAIFIDSTGTFIFLALAIFLGDNRKLERKS
ncbi:hypothetical protein ONV75_12325 [Clostridium sp. LQ25]|uniref:hypothetical protein n=1 Tax=Clostridium sp. LQ25 TaxID=2992805 RepID=UPI0022594B4F|nr:hypothetical protein [Clostridium sp. LQ25]UZT05370.1 hypothetical protein ONV75_12325 [Clostridium sp. LQ25]